mmetsp:Transcript_17886/g.46262  ORF Transcript_17886/g.46262 Transcript_17886/m.46262 type:complete len:219 (+) Transcript_17886:666-1322(+)
MAIRVNAVAAGLDADQLDVFVPHERVEHADRVRAAADARDHHVGHLARVLLDLLPSLLANHRLEVAHDGREGVRADGRADQVVRGAHVGHPVAHRLVDGVFERLGPRVDRVHLRAEHLHPEHVERLAADILRPHVHDALEPHERAHGGGGDAVLPRASLGDDALLVQPLRQQRLPNRVVDLVRARVCELLALEPDLRATAVRREALCVVHWRRAADVL